MFFLLSSKFCNVSYILPLWGQMRNSQNRLLFCFNRLSLTQTDLNRNFAAAGSV